MKITITSLFCIFLAFVARSQSMFVASTYNTNSTEGDFYGTWTFSFSTNDFTPAGGGQPSNVGAWHTASSTQTFTDPQSGAAISVYFDIGGLQSGNNEFDVSSTINVSDPALGSISGGVGDGGGQGYQENGMLVYPGQATDRTNYVSQDIFHYHSFTTGYTGQGTVDLLQNTYFDGVSGTGGGTWDVIYTVPEPATVIQITLGGLCLCLARYRQRRQN